MVGMYIRVVVVVAGCRMGICKNQINMTRERKRREDKEARIE